MKRELIVYSIIVSIVAMYLYASFSKFFDFAGFDRAMHNQPFPLWLSELLKWVLPPAEMVVALSLFFKRARRLGLLVSTILMGVFTAYIVAILLHFFRDVPCSCGGIIREFTWKQHLLFNLFFFTISIIGYFLEKWTPIGYDNKEIDLNHKNISRAKSG